MERRFKVGDRVTDGRYKGVIDAVFPDDPKLWDYRVRFDGGWCESRDDIQLSRDNPIHEVVGVVKAGSWGDIVGDKSISNILNGYMGKRVRLTVEELVD